LPKSLISAGATAILSDGGSFALVEEGAKAALFRYLLVASQKRGLRVFSDEKNRAAYFQDEAVQERPPATPLALF
tara:strand:+ start:203 stop:427 length:225 start_codon:yes stop_codon:yes gene_type:complete